MRKAKRTILIAMLILAGLVPVCSARTARRTAKRYSAKELIAKIIASERKIRDVELHYDYIILNQNNRVYTTFDWGYEQGKEYYAGKVFEHPPLEMNIPPFVDNVKVAFDGDRIRRFQEKGALADYDRGRICPFKWDHFVYPRPTALLGDDTSRGRRTFGEILRDAPKVLVREKPEVIDGRPCRVLEAFGIVDRRSPYDVRVWIDTARDYRPLRIEKYRSIAGKNRWQVPTRVIEKIKLEKINGVWFPVEGETCGFFTKKVLPPVGMTEADIRRLPPGKWREVSTFVMKPGDTGTVRVKVNKDTVRINKGIDPGKFTIEFPQGCRVYDDFLQLAYVVGQPDAAVDRVILEEIANFEPKTEAGEPNDLPGKDPNLSRTKPLQPPEEASSRPETQANNIEIYGKYLMIGVLILVVAAIAIALRKVTIKGK